MLSTVDLRIILAGVLNYFVHFGIDFVETKTKLSPSTATTTTTTTKGLTKLVANKHYKKQKNTLLVAMQVSARIVQSERKGQT